VPYDFVREVTGISTGLWNKAHARSGGAWREECSRAASDACQCLFDRFKEAFDAKD